ncbi:MAG: pyruvate formate lyase family protein, partial [Firmicutes bacterium]|nr:pyruvate formate lyase family protein [Bacillota bacterium]
MLKEDFLRLGEYAASGLYEEPDRSLFYRKALGLRRFYENCELAVYRGESLYPSGVIAQKMNVVPHYMSGLTFVSNSLNEKAPSLAEKLSEEFCVYHSTVPKEHTVAGNMYTHSMPNYERIVKEGLLSYIPRIEMISDTDMREGLLHVIRGIEHYIMRCVMYLESVSADEMLIASLKRVPLYPAETAYDAIVAWNFIMYLDNCDNLGCLGKGILPYYKGENLIPYLENLYDNLDKNNGYSMSLDSECPELTVQCLKAAHGKRRPMIELFVDESTPEIVWEAALSAVKSGGGQPAFYNAGVLFEGLKKRFPSIRDEDLSSYCGGGCTESMFTGFSNVGSLDAGINLLLIL